jgi:glutathione S-transferase
MLKLVIGDKNLSSWSLRPWLLLKHSGLEFEEVRLPLDTPFFRETIRTYSPTRRVPVLLDGTIRVWDSLAICEYVNERMGGQAWPSDPATRAHARAVSAEMHSGFQALRTNWSMRATVMNLNKPLGPEAAADVARIDELWSDCRERYGAEGRWLFGHFSIADAMFAPVLLRFNSYGAELAPTAAEYLRFGLQDPHLQEWLDGAAREIAEEGRPTDHV